MARAPAKTGHTKQIAEGAQDEQTGRISRSKAKAKDTPQGKAMDQAQPETVASVAKPKAKGKAKALKVADVKALAVAATGVGGRGQRGRAKEVKFQAKKKATATPRAEAKSKQSGPLNSDGSIQMNNDILEGKWKQMRGQAKEWWGKLTDDDLDRVAGKSEQLIGLLQENMATPASTPKRSSTGG